MFTAFRTFLYGIIASCLLLDDAVPAAEPPARLSGEHHPEVERKSFKLLPGFEANLFAAEPMLVNPIHMAWDAQGRLWVCCSTSYPQLKPGQKPGDQIIVLEDTNGDGRADKSTVFAEGLYVPTGLELGDGGVYVANAPDLLFLKDTDGDLRADVRQVVLTGFGTEDNHHCISAWRWGPGGWLYFQEGTFLHTQVETPHGPVRLENGGVFQFRPRDLRLRVFADYRASNPWGHMFDRWGQSILIDNPNLYFLAPLTANSRAKLSYDSSGRGTKQAGGEFTSGRHLPPEYRGQIWTNQYKAHIVTRYQLTDDGSGYAIKELEPLIRSSSPNFRPVDLKMGPDGAVYILDWYNPLIGHMQHSFRDERRDTTHGRVWRVTYKGRPLVKRPKLLGVPLAELLEHLKDPEDWTRHQVKRALSVADPKQAAAALQRWVDSLDPDDEEYEHHLLEALWCYQTIDVVNEQLLRRVLACKDGRARAAAVRVLRYWRKDVKAPLGLLATAIADDHARVRLEAVLTLGYLPDARSVAIAASALDKPMDRYLEHALKLTVDGLQPHWLAAYRAGKLKFDREEHRTFALSNLLSNESVQVMIDLLNSGSVDPKRLEGPAEAVAQSATARQLEKLVLTMVEHTREYRTRGKEATDPQALTVVLRALDQAARQRGVTPAGVNRMVPRCFDVPDASTQTAAARLVGAWKLRREAGRLKRLVNTPGDFALRQAAVESLGELGGKANLEFFDQLMSATPEKRYLGVLGLAAADLKAGAAKAGEILSADPKDANPTPVVAAFLDRKSGADLLAAALNKTKPHPAVASRALQHLIEIGEQHPGLVKALGGDVKAGSLEALLLKEDVKKLAAEVLKLGDPARGELIFRRKSLACMSCHGIGNAGPELGPDLAAIGSSSPGDYLVDSFLRPSKVIKEFYETAVIQTSEGKVINGILRFKDDKKVVVLDAAHGGKEITISTTQIEQMAKGKSLMPTGLANKLRNRQEFLDLVRFVTELGRPGPYATSVAQVVRRWRVHAIDGKLDQIEASHLSDAAHHGTPAYSMVSGLLPAGDLPREKPSVVAIGHVDVTTAGNVRLKLNSTTGLRLFVDGREVPADDPVVELPVGRRTLACVISTASRGKDGLRVELVDVSGSAAAYKVVGGP